MNTQPNQPRNEVHVAIIGGQGTYTDCKYYTEFPDRELCIEYITRFHHFNEFFRCSHVVPSGGFTQKQTPQLSEAGSVLNIWDEFQVRPACDIVSDQVSLDSAENLLLGLMACRLYLKDKRPIKRIAYYCLWQFKKPRMTGLAKLLGIDQQFFFFGHAQANRSNAGRQAEEGELAQLKKMEVTDDFLLLGEEWEQKRHKRFQGTNAAYSRRLQRLQARFPHTFAAMHALQTITAAELRRFSPTQLFGRTAVSLACIREAKKEALRRAFRTEVLMDD